MNTISTTKGDYGKTNLWSGERVWKDDERVEAYGDFDELEAFLGEAKHYVSKEYVYEKIVAIQKDLFKINAELASKSKKFENAINSKDVERITGWVHDIESKINLKGFVIRGSMISSAKLDICCAILRRAERKVVKLGKTQEVSDTLKSFVNRLSDLLFILARWEEYLAGKIEYL